MRLSAIRVKRSISRGNVAGDTAWLGVSDMQAVSR